MLTLSKFEGKTLEEVKENCLNELNVTEDKIFFKQSETEAKLLKVATSDNILIIPNQYRDDLRANIFKNMLLNLVDN